MIGAPFRDSFDVVREVLSLSGARVLDVGCGNGALVRMMTREGARATGLEISDAQLARATAEPPVGSEAYRVGRAEALPFDDQTFDIVVFFNSLHHVPVESQEKGLAESARVLGKGGHLLVMEPVADGSHFELMRPVDDETEVRAAAYVALRRAADGPDFEELREYSFETEYHCDSFETFKEGVLQVDGSRREAFDAHETQIRKDFERIAVRAGEGYSLTQPKRLNLLKRL